MHERVGNAPAMKHCATCQGKTGRSDGPAISLLSIKAPTGWTDKTKMASESDQFLTEIIEKGGRAVGKSTHMPPFEKKLNASRVADIVAYIRSLAK